MARMAFGTDGALSRPAPDARPPELDAAIHTSRDCFQVRSDSKSSGAIFVPPDAHAFLVQVFRVLPARVQRVPHQRLHICRAGAVMHLPVHHFWSAKGELDRPRWPRVLRGHVELLPRVLVPLHCRHPVRPAGHPKIGLEMTGCCVLQDWLCVPAEALFLAGPSRMCIHLRSACQPADTECAVARRRRFW